MNILILGDIALDSFLVKMNIGVELGRRLETLGDGFEHNGVDGNLAVKFAGGVELFDRIHEFGDFGLVAVTDMGHCLPGFCCHIRDDFSLNSEPGCFCRFHFFFSVFCKFRRAVIIL